MRDLFQVVFELKKKEIELARQQIQSKSIHDHQSLSSLASLKGGASGHNDLSGGPSSLSMLSSLNAGATGSNLKMGYNIGDAKNNFNNVKEVKFLLFFNWFITKADNYLLRCHLNLLPTLWI